MINSYGCRHNHAHILFQQILSFVPKERLNLVISMDDFPIVRGIRRNHQYSRS